jgi:hypothetical protein
MLSRGFRVVFPVIVLCCLSFSGPLFGQVHQPRHSRYPNSPSNDPQLQIPTDQAQSCFTPEGTRGDYEQFQQFDSYPQPASKGYLCINIPAGRTFVVDHLFAEADYDAVLPGDAEWYLNSTLGGYEQMTGFAAARVGSATANPHYVLSQAVHLAVMGGTRVTLIMHNYYVNTGSSITETPGSASFSLIGHWE